MIYLILGHSGSGKSTLRDELAKKGLNKIITYTTRPPRPKEVDGLDYNFINIK
ncbi:MAG: guanylate kinase, partial [Peptoniphilus harei]|nr:guanylate kinase [Peptoniphilus harei]